MACVPRACGEKDTPMSPTDETWPCRRRARLEVPEALPGTRPKAEGRILSNPQNERRCPVSGLQLGREGTGGGSPATTTSEEDETADHERRGQLGQEQSKYVFISPLLPL